MKELDNEYKRLIKIRYVLRTLKNISSKADLEREVDSISDSADMLEKITLDIADCLNEWKMPKKKAKKEAKENGIEESQKEAKEKAKENGIEESQKEAKEKAKENGIEESQKEAKEKAKENGIEVGQEEDKKEKKSPCISRITLGRIMGVYGKIGKTVGGDISRSNLDRIAKYIGRLNWTSVVSMDSEDIEESMLREHKFAEDSGILSQLDDGEDKYGTGLSRLISHNLLPKQIVDIRYGNGKLLKLKKLKEGDKFMVEYCDSRVLEKGWVISIPCFFVGVNVTGLGIRYNGDSIKDYYKSGGVVTSIKIVDDIWSW